MNEDIENENTVPNIDNETQESDVIKTNVPLEGSETKIKTKFYEYFVKITKTKVLSAEEEKKRRIIAAKGESVEDIETVECYHQNTKDEELNIFKKFSDEEYDAINELPEDVKWFKSKTENIVEYSYDENENSEEIEETENKYIILTEFFYRLYEGEKDKPEDRVSGLCVECKYALLSRFPFPHFVCSKRKRICGVTGREIYFRCKDFNEYLECNLWEPIPPEEEIPEKSPIDEPTENEGDDNGNTSNGAEQTEGSGDENQGAATDDTTQSGNDSGTNETGDSGTTGD